MVDDDKNIKGLRPFSPCQGEELKEAPPWIQECFQVTEKRGKCPLIIDVTFLDQPDITFWVLLKVSVSLQFIMKAENERCFIGGHCPRLV